MIEKIKHLRIYVFIVLLFSLLYFTYNSFVHQNSNSDSNHERMSQQPEKGKIIDEGSSLNSNVNQERTVSFNGNHLFYLEGSVKSLNITNSKKEGFKISFLYSIPSLGKKHKGKKGVFDLRNNTVEFETLDNGKIIKLNNNYSFTSNSATWNFKI